jgi:creatinine amidohydrolase
MYTDIGAAEYEWAGRTAAAIGELAARDGSVAILPVASIEQHGDHLPVATDSILVDAIAQLGAERVSGDLPVLVTPVVWMGYSPHHMSFGGTITTEFRTLLTILEDTADAVLDNGFDALVLLNGHGGNAALIASATSTIGREHPSVEVLGLTYFQLAQRFEAEIRDSDIGGMAHGGEFETALMQFLRPDLVGEGDAPYWDEPYELGGQDLLHGGPLSVYREFREYSDTGAIGDPSLATPEKGERIYTLLGDAFEELLREIHRRNRD